MVPHKPTFDTFTKQPGGSVFQAHSAVLSFFSCRESGAKEGDTFAQTTWHTEDAGRVLPRVSDSQARLKDQP